MGARYRHFKTVCRHKAIVLRECHQCGITWQGLVHDLSKFSPTEFSPSAKYFQGDKSPIEAEKEAIGYSDAWLHHKAHNKHHWEYWTDFGQNGEVLPHKIPYRYVVEMICDWISAGMVYSGDTWTQASPIEYYTKVRQDRHFHPQTEMLIIQFLKCIRDNGLNEFHKMAKCQPPYSYIQADYEGWYLP